MNRHTALSVRMLLVTLITAAFTLVVVPASNTQSNSPPAADKPVEQTRKNIQVLQGLPDSQLFLAMNFVSDSLGVHCDYCHVKEADKWLWDRDDKKPKSVGRDMMRMVLELNKAKFDGAPVVTCYSCHHGNLRVERIAPLPPRDFVKERLGAENKPLPSVKEVVERYRAAVGAKSDALSKPIVMRGVVERSTNPGPFEIIIEQPNKMLGKQTTPQGVTTEASNGSIGWSQTSKGTTQMNEQTFKQFNAVATLFQVVKISDTAANGEVTRIAKVDDRDAYDVSIDGTATQSTHLFFDVETGLLVRVMTVTNTMLGPLNVQRDFLDYRDVGGLKLPFTIRTSDVASFDTAVRKFSEIKIDSTVDDKVFEMPRAGSRP
jgi:hypothetical protein